MWKEAKEMERMKMKMKIGIKESGRRKRIYCWSKKARAKLKMNEKRVANIVECKLHYIPLKMNSSSQFALIIRGKFDTENKLLLCFHSQENSLHMQICAHTSKRVNFIKSHYKGDILDTIISFLAFVCTPKIRHHQHFVNIVASAVPLNFNGLESIVHHF